MARPVSRPPLDDVAAAARALNPQAAPAETTWFGGTHWDATDHRYEANLNGLWTFDSGIGSSLTPAPLGKPAGYHALMEGWQGKDLELNPNLQSLQKFERRFRSDFSGPACVGSDAPPLAGNASLWAGLTAAEAAALCWAGGQGMETPGTWPRTMPLATPAG